MYQDTPGKYDAWDIVASYMEHEIALTEPGKLTIDESRPAARLAALGDARCGVQHSSSASAWRPVRAA